MGLSHATEQRNRRPLRQPAIILFQMPHQAPGRSAHFRLIIARNTARMCWRRCCLEKTEASFVVMTGMKMLSADLSYRRFAAFQVHDDPSPPSGGPFAAGQRRWLRRPLRRDENKIGLLPKQGWQQRNLQFLGDVLIPTLLSPRKPGLRSGPRAGCGSSRDRHHLAGTRRLPGAGGGRKHPDRPQLGTVARAGETCAAPELYAHDLPPLIWCSSPTLTSIICTCPA